MKLLIITQAVDTKHPILGFFHRWVEEFATHCEQVQVICLESGTYNFPANVTVHSLGKEVGKGRLSYLVRFYSLIWSLRREYDGVFVHMNQVYVLLGALIWKSLRKRVSLWYTHGAVSSSLRLAERFVDVIFTAAAEGFNLKSKKVFVTGHGIDTARFTLPPVPKNIDLITVGRITPSKNILTLVDILYAVRKTHPISLTVVGGTTSDSDVVYESQVRARVHELGLNPYVTFTGSVPPVELPRLLNQSRVFVTAAQNGSLDKAMLEAMAASLAIVSSAPGSTSLPLRECQVTTTDAFIEAVNRILDSGRAARPDHATYVREHHSLEGLIPRIISRLQ